MSLLLSSLAAVLLLAALTPGLLGCGKSAQPPSPAPPSVTVKQPAQEPVTDYVELTGTASAFRSVDLVARVTGYLQSVNFEDGTYVEEGRLLFVIEPEPYKEQLRLAQAALDRAQSEYQRQLGLRQQNATSLATVERWLSERDQAAAQVELAKINLGYTQVKAPFKGRIGRRLVDPGNLVSPTANTKLATLEQLVPIYVYFNLNERDALQLRQERQQQQGARTEPPKAPVLVGLQNQEGYPQAGTLDFVDTGVNPSLGTIQMRAVLKNEDRILFPGVFARVRIPLGEPHPMLVVPAQATGSDQEGDYVLVVGPNEVVARRTVVKGPLTPNGYAIRRGLAAEDRVIVSGLMKARPGTKVTPLQATHQSSNKQPPAPEPTP